MHPQGLRFTWGLVKDGEEWYGIFNNKEGQSWCTPSSCYHGNRSMFSSRPWGKGLLLNSISPVLNIEYAEGNKTKALHIWRIYPHFYVINSYHWLSVDSVWLSPLWPFCPRLLRWNKHTGKLCCMNIGLSTTLKTLQTLKYRLASIDGSEKRAFQCLLPFVQQTLKQQHLL